MGKRVKRACAKIICYEPQISVEKYNPTSQTHRLGPLLFQKVVVVNMEADTLHLHLDFVASSGVVLSVEQKAALQSSLVILKAQQKFKHVQFWGKILGIKNDYFIVEGVGNDELKERKRLYR